MQASDPTHIPEKFPCNTTPNDKKVQKETKKM